MERRTRKRAGCIFIFAFLVLTFLCWCPILYGTYGPVERILGVPSWAIIAAVFGIVLFVVEWIYLFVSGLAMNDDGLPEKISELSKLNIDDEVSTGEDN